MNKEEIKSKVLTILENLVCAEPDKVRMDDHLQNDLGADSLDLVELIMELEKEFQIAIDDREFEDVETVQDTIDLVEKLN